MMTDLVTCDHCGTAVARVRQAQRYCSKQCRKSGFKRRAGMQREASPAAVEKRPPATTLPEKRPPAPAAAAPTPDAASAAIGATPGALQGDDYPLEYYEDGYPKLPACLDRRVRPEIEEKAA